MNDNRSMINNFCDAMGKTNATIKSVFESLTDDELDALVRKALKPEEAEAQEEEHEYPLRVFVEESYDMATKADATLVDIMNRLGIPAEPLEILDHDDQPLMQQIEDVHDTVESILANAERLKKSLFG